MPRRYQSGAYERAGNAVLTGTVGSGSALEVHFAGRSGLSKTLDYLGLMGVQDFLMDHENATAKDYEFDWLRLQRRQSGDVDFAECEWVVDGWIFWPSSRPVDLWNAIIGISKLNLTENEAEQLGTGPLESLLSERFKQFAPMALHEGRRNSLFATALNAVIPPEANEDEFDELLTVVNSYYH